jgi:hypothetical protein
MLRLDLMSIIQVEKPTGLPGMVYFRSSFADKCSITSRGRCFLPYEFLEPNIPSAARYGFHIAYHIARKRNGSSATDRAVHRIRKGDRVILVGVTAAI